MSNRKTYDVYATRHTVANVVISVKAHTGAEALEKAFNVSDDQWEYLDDISSEITPDRAERKPRRRSHEEVGSR